MNLKIGDSVIIKPKDELPNDNCMGLMQKQLSNQIVSVKQIVNFGDDAMIEVLSSYDTNFFITSDWIAKKVSMTDDGVVLEDI